MGKYSVIPAQTYDELILGEGVLAYDFDPASGTLDPLDIIAATSSSNIFKATPLYTDMGDKLTNCPKNTLELKRLDGWNATISGKACTASSKWVKTFVGASEADSDGVATVYPSKIKDESFCDIWLIADYSSVNTGEDAGFIAIRLKNALSDGGKLILSPNQRGVFDYSFRAHQSITQPGEPPFEVYLRRAESQDGQEVSL